MLTHPRRLLAGSVIATGMLIGSQAFALPSVTGAFTSGQNTWSDDSGEYIVDNNNNGQPDVGDYVLGFFGVTSYGTGVPANSVNQLSGFFALEITSAIPIGSANPNRSNFSFAAPGVGIVNAFAVGGVTVPAPISSDANVAFEIFEGPPNTFTRNGSTSFDVLVNTAITPFQMMDWAITDGQITAIAPTDLNDPEFPLPVGTGIGSFEGSTTIVYQSFPGYTFAPLVTLVGNNSIPNNPLIASNFENDPAKFEPYSVRDDITYTLSAITTTPEPATLALLALGLLGLGAVRRWS